MASDMTNKVLLYVELNGQVWAILEDGSWLVLQDSLPNSIDIPFIRNLESYLSENVAGELVFNFQDKTFVVESKFLNPNFIENTQTEQNRSSNAYQSQADNLISIENSGSGLGFTTQIRNNNDEALAEAGYQTRPTEDLVTVVESIESNSPISLADDASVTIVIEDGGDDVINQYEVETTLIHGTIFDVDDDREVLVTVTDQSGNILTFTAIVTNNSWSLGEVDLSALGQGPITATAVITDFYENTISANTDSNIDTLAEIDIQFAQSEQDNVINNVESKTETLSGTLSYVEDGQEVTVTVTDINGLSATLTTTVINSGWQLSDNDLSQFSDGQLTAIASVTDIAGNIATSTTSIIKDTIAKITLNVDTGDDSTLNSEESTNTTYSGTVIDVEDGQTITIVTTDESGFSNTVTTTVENGEYEITNIDLSGIRGEQITVTASVEDTAGNPAEVTNVVDIDINAFIIVRFFDDTDAVFNLGEGEDSLGDGYLNKEESTTTKIAGYTYKVDNGAEITLTVTDSTGFSVDFTTTVDTSDGLSYSIEKDFSQEFEGTLNGASVKQVLAEGELTVVAKVTDASNNEVSSSDTTIKDTLASIEVSIESLQDDANSDDVDYDYLNAQEINAGVVIKGSVSNVEDGKTVSITLTHSSGTEIPLTAVVSNGEFVVSPNIDFSGFEEGDVSVTAVVTDTAGNEASDTDSVIKDTLVVIDIDTDTNPDNGYTAVEGTSGFNTNDFMTGKLTSISGTSSAEEGQPVTISISDGDTIKTFAGTTVAGGAWTVENIDISALDINKAWQVSATVTDKAGNSASDEMPDLTLLDTIELTEENLNSFANSESIALNINSENTQVIFYKDQPQDGLTSEGSALFNKISEDGLSIQVYRESDGQLVFNAVIDSNGTSVHVSLFEPLDHEIDSDELTTSLLLSATQTDDDGTSETSIMPLTFELTDSVAIAVDDAYQVVEQQSTTGNLLDNDSAVDGEPVINSVTVGSDTAEVVAGSSTVFKTEKGQLSVNADGSWTFVAASNLDHSVDQALEFTYQIIDLDGDTSTATSTITITDGERGSMDAQTVADTEGTVAIERAPEKTFTITAGSDNLDPSTIRFTTGSIALLESLDLSSNGDALSYSLDEDNTIIATVDGETVFTLVVSAVTADTANADTTNLAGKLTLTQSLPLDHISSDELTLRVGISATDEDGTGIFPTAVDWTISDGENASIETTKTIAIDESDLSSGNVTDSSGTFTVTPGSDNTESVAFDPTKQPELSAGGEVIFYEIVGDKLQGSTSAGVIFDVELTGDLAAQASSELGYSFTLYQAIDQLEDGTHQDSIDINFVVSVTDGDNDITDQSLLVNIADSGDATITGDGFEVTETPKASTTTALTNTDTSILTIEANQDPITALTLDVNSSDPVTLADGTTAVTQNGEAVIWQVNGNGDYKGVLADGTVVFTLTLPDSLAIAAQQSTEVALTFELVGAIDHLIDDTEVSLLFPIIATDSDGSIIEHDIQASMLDGELPSLNFTDVVTLDENVLLTGNDSDKTSYDLTSGSDQVVSVQPVLAGDVISSITSNGKEITFASEANDNGWWIARSDDGVVFKVKFNLDGTVNTQLVGVLDHPDAGADNLAISLEVVAVDADGDVSEPATITINVLDDVPDSSTVTVIVEEGQTETLDLLGNDQAGADGGSITAISIGDTSYTVGQEIELIRDGNDYGTLTINADGTGELTTNDTLSGLGALGEIKYTITDGDGDTAESILVLGIADEAGEVTIDNVDLVEDVAQTLALVVSVGDADDGEAIAEVRFDIDSLNGGELTYNGSVLTLSNDGTYYFLSGADFQAISTDSTSYQPIYDLVFTPALNTSNQIDSQQVSLAITAEINKNIGGNVILTNNIDLNIESVADKPIWNESGDNAYIYNLLEDAEQQTIKIGADLYDDDTSEILTYEIGTIDSELTLTINGDEVASGDILSAAEVSLLEVLVAENIGGSFSFEITPVATEQENNDSANGETKEVVFNVTPVADTPNLAVFDANGIEDTIVLLNDVLNGELTDTDGSESLSYLITVPDGWSVVAVDGSDAIVSAQGNNVYSVSDADVIAGNVGLMPAANVSSATGTYQITAQAVSTETEQGGLFPNPETASSEEQTFEVFIQGVVDAPTISAGGDWSYDGDTQIISNNSTLYEDALISLDMGITTADTDGSENINLLLSNIPDGFTFTDVNGDALEVSVAQVDDNGKATYQVTLADLSSLYLKPTTDFSGEVTFNIDTVITEADGDAKPDGISGSEPDDSLFSLTVNIELTPVIDSDASTLNINDQGVEDTLTPLYLLPNDLADSDGSETITSFTIESLGNAGTLYFDGTEITTPVIIESLEPSTNLEELLNSGRLTIKPPTDASGTFTYNISYEVTDTSETDKTVTETFTDTASITISAEVEDLLSDDNETLDDITRLESDKTTQTSSDGSAIALDGLVQFYDQDDDGSEYIDYLVIKVPDEQNWIVSHATLNVIHDENGRWLIDTSGLTSASIMEDGIDILAGVTIYSSEATTQSSSILVSAHVNDGTDKEMIDATLQVHFTADGTDSSASSISTLQKDYIKGEEDSAINIGSQINNSHSDLTADTNDILSFKILVADLPYGGAISGAGVIVDYDSTGKNVVQYLFTADSLSSLVLSGLDEDFAGTFEVPITTIATDSISGETKIEDQTLQFEINPVVDGLEISSDATEILEDTLTSLDLETTLFSDSNLADQGIESVSALSFTLPDGGLLSANDGVLTLTNGVYTVNDLDQIDSISYQGPLNYSGDVSINFTAEITDTANGYAGDLTATATGEVTGSLNIDILPVTDQVTITTETITGDEDTEIDLSSLSVDFIDDDGSETMSIVINGVPSGAVLTSGDSVLANNGVDGGTFNGEPTYTWTVTADQLANLSLLPPLDFSGDIPLSVEVIGYEVGTDDYVTTTGDFTVEVNPIADQTQFTSSVEQDITGEEGQVTEFDLTGMSTETDSNETLILTVKILNTSDTTALDGLDRIRIGSAQATFSIVNGVAIATLAIASNELNGFELLTGDAYGHFDIDIGLSSTDTATVGGSEVSNTSSEATRVSTTLDLEAVLDKPQLTLEADSVFVEAGNDISLPIDFTLVNEQGYIEVTGLPDGASISGVTPENGIWTIPQDDIESAVISGLSSQESFDLTITPYATLGDETVSDNPQTLTVNVLASGDNTIVATDDADRFVFSYDELLTTTNQATDTIVDFEVSADSIDVSSLYAARGDNDIDALIDLKEENGTTTLQIKTSGSDVTQEIVIESTTINELYGSDASSVSEADILNKLIEDNTLVTA